MHRRVFSGGHTDLEQFRSSQNRKFTQPRGATLAKHVRLGGMGEYNWTGNALSLAGFLDQHVTFHFTEPVKIHPPRKVVDLVLHRGRPQP